MAEHDPIGAAVTADNLALFTDLYELTMLQAYLEEDMAAEATFSLFVRRLPARRNYLLACGLEHALDYLETVRFSADCLVYLASLRHFTPRFLDWLAGFRCTGEVYAVPEGTPVFAGEPLLEVVAPIAEAQLAETFVMNQVHLQTLLASKAVRVVAAAGRPVIDFGARRMHGTDAALKAARAYHIAGIAATSNVLAGKLHGVPVAGTMAHSYIQAHRDEALAFRTFSRLCSRNGAAGRHLRHAGGGRQGHRARRRVGVGVHGVGRSPRFRRPRTPRRRSAGAARFRRTAQGRHLRQRWAR